MRTVGQAVSGLDEQLFVGREQELAAFRQWLVADTDLPETLNVSGPGGMGKSALLRAFCRIALEVGRPAVLADAHTFRATPEGLLHALGGGRTEEVLASLNETRPLLILDSFEELADLTRYLREEFFPGLDTGVKVVVAGRYPLARYWSREGSWSKLIRPLPLEGLSTAESRAYLGRRGVCDPRLIDQILNATGGHPLALSLAADMVLQFRVRDFAAAPEWRLIVHSLVERLLGHVDDPRFRELLEACAVIRQFNEATLEAVSGQQDIGAAFDELCRLSAVRPSEHGLMLHEDVRRILAEDLRWRRPERYNELRLRALAYYRERMRSALPAEREWLLAERFYLWEHGLVQALLFSEHEPGQVWMEAARPEDHADVLRIWSFWLNNILAAQQDAELDRDALEAERPFLEALLRHPTLRLCIARDRDGEAVGVSAVLPVYRDTAEFLTSCPVRGPLIQAYWSPEELAALPATAEGSNIFYLVLLAHTEWKPEAVRAVLLRNWFGLLALGGVYLVTTALPDYKSMLEACGFERIEQARRPARHPELPADGYALDLTAIGVEAWITAIMSGRRPPKPLGSSELERELQTALLHLHDDAWLARSPLAEMVAMGAGESRAQGPEAVRGAVLEALDRARARARPEDELAYRALELVYLPKAVSRQQAAAQLAVSRPTFYRLLKRGVQGVASVLNHHPLG
jgi:hypothetical protein